MSDNLTNIPDHIPSIANEYLFLSAMISNPEIYRKTSQYINKNFFDRKYQKVYEFIDTFYNENKELPKRVIVYEKTGLKLEPDSEFKDRGVSEYITNDIIEFCKKKEMEAFINSCAETLNSKQQKNESLDDGILNDYLKKIKEISSISPKKDVGYEFHKDAAILLSRAEEQSGFPVHIELLDHVLDGGVTKPSLNIVSAASGHGKSLMLQNLAILQIKNGCNAIYFTLELSAELLAKRFAAISTGINIANIFKEKDSVLFDIKRSEKKNGKLRIVKLKQTGTTVADIISHYREICEIDGVNYDNLYVDYLGLLSPTDKTIKSDNLSAKDKSIADALVDFANEPGEQKIIWTAEQTKKGQDTEKGASQGAIAGGKGKVDNCDNLIVIKRTIEDIQNGIGWLHMQKVRSAKGFNTIVPVNWNIDNLQITSGDRTLFEEANPFFANIGKSSNDKKDVIIKPATTNQSNAISTIRERLEKSRIGD